METYVTICKIDSQWEFTLWLRKLNQRLCINLEGWDAEEMGGGSKGGRFDRKQQNSAKHYPSVKK